MDVEEVLSQLTVDEKVDLISGIDFWHTKAVPRLRIPSLRMSDGPNGVRGTRFFNGVRAACFPCGTGLAATWDADLIREGGALMGKEAVAKGASILLGPTVNMQRSPLGGRGFESFSEDPVLAGWLSAATVEGIQSTGVVATIKHFVGNDQEERRQSSNSVVSERALREVYLLPFQIAERRSKPKGYMTAYNKVNGIHASESPRLLQDILRDEWGFDGIVISDWYGTYSVAEAINAGLDIEMPGPPRWRGLLARLSVSCEKVTEHALNDRVRALLKTINHVSPLNIPEHAVEKTIDTPETTSKLREIASSGIVLLKNESGVLPLKKEKTVAVIGPNAKFAAYSGGGSAGLRAYYTVSPFDGISSQMESVRYAIGVTGYKKLPMLSSMTEAPDGTRGMEMRIYLDPPMVENRKPVEVFNITESNCFLNDYKHPDIKTNLFYAEIEGTLRPDVDSEYLFSLCVNGTARLFVNDEEVVDNATTQRPGESFFGSGTLEEIGSESLRGGEAYKILVQFATAPTSKLHCAAGATQMGVGGLQIGGCVKTDPATLRAEAVSLAKQVDQVVLCMGLNAEWESEGWDRQNMDLPPGSDTLVEAVADANPNTIVVNQSGTPVTLPWASKVPAIMQAWYGGNETGNAIADVLFGETNPSGKLSLSWPQAVEHNPAFVNTRLDRGNVVYGEGVHVGYRWYEKVKKRTLFPFGHGLSYSTFKLANLAISGGCPQAADELDAVLTFSVDVANTGGARAGAEVVQVYVSKRERSVPRPSKELKGFAKVKVAPGTTETARVDVEKKYACSFWDERARSWAMEKGLYDVLIGNSSDNIILRGQLEVGKTRWWRGL